MNWSARSFWSVEVRGGWFTPLDARLTIPGSVDLVAGWLTYLTPSYPVDAGRTAVDAVRMAVDAAVTPVETPATAADAARMGIDVAVTPIETIRTALDEETLGVDAAAAMPDGLA